MTKPLQLRHLLGISELNQENILYLLNKAEQFITHQDQEILLNHRRNLSQVVLANLFFEPSTRTRCSFELAAKYLGATVINFNPELSSLSKGESILDTIYNLQAMGVNMLAIRHSQNGAPQFIAQHVKPRVAVINAGDGTHEHPTQALLDMLTIRQHKGDFKKLTVAIVGDILHSRAARSQILALQRLEVAEIRAIGPSSLLPSHLSDLGIKVYRDLKAGLQDVDVIMMLRLQKERMQAGLLPGGDEYFKFYGLSKTTLGYAKPDAIIMHPAPINRGIEIESAVADCAQSVILQQPTYGVAIRMAVIECLAESRIYD